MAERIGILGGSFDPIHLGHIRLAEAARDRLALDRVVLVPAAQQPLKLDRRLAPAEDRLAMARLAAEGRPWLEVSDVEVARGGVSYTVDTLRELRRRLGPEAELFLIAGADILRDLGRWRGVDEILRLATLALATRPGHALEIPPEIRARRVDLDALPISSTDVRARLASGAGASHLLDPRVDAYIGHRRLYAG